MSNPNAAAHRPMRPITSRSWLGPEPDLGFSLVEMLVVTTLLAVLSLSAVLSLRSETDRSPAAALAAFARGVGYLRDDAFFTGRAYALSYSETGWTVLRFDPETASWVRRDPRALHSGGDWQGAGRLTVRIEGRQIALQPGPRTGLGDRAQDVPSADTILLPDGDATPTEVVLAKPGTGTMHCILSGLGQMQCQPAPGS